MPKQSQVKSDFKINDMEFKRNFIKLLSSFTGLPKGQQQQFDRIIACLKSPDTVITKDDWKTVSIIIAALFCGVNVPNFPMNIENKKLVETFTDKNHNELVAKQASIKKR